MRLRNVKGSREKIADNQFVIHNPEEYKGLWKQVFKNDNPLHIEIGMGKGQFIIKMALNNPHINFIGIEKYSSVLVRAIEKREEVELNNLFFIRMDAEDINNVFDKNEVAQIYLNFSDPWPKERHAKRRLTSHQFLAKYNQFLEQKGKVIFKTDNKELFEFSLEEVSVAQWILESKTFDLHHSDEQEGNVMTEYEQKFSEEGKPICRMIIHR
ncbi:tRNA (guanosine(46)-N7)-methyltransferase TrmB [Anaeromicropila populeti]|uniref:tRNA (guanine-N(7)-)-methyltransferase n=1 Tax=Anaeromicropila populeti TaxID=37658 RepID=A0A1I6LBX1_9FIRM|nr:tRNA (guanosine(46)-N7)-methyltransferase TrmB [Anaeromicropila populeti]SFS00710.1 tRNA (guanine-N7-)-methyltransferase [Anaeromicropila populeti]